MKMQYNATAPTVVDNTTVDPQSSVRGELLARISNASTLVARLLSAAASTNATVVKATPGSLFTIVGVNANVAARYLKIYNKATSPTVGTDTPVATLYLPPSSVNGGQFVFNFTSQPLNLTAGIGYALTTAAADADTGALTAGDVIALNITYA
jgi:hypothetical protein